MRSPRPDLFKVRQAISDCAARVLDLDHLIRRCCHRYIFAYHRILPLDVVGQEYIQDCMWTTPDTFEGHIKWMLQVGEVVAIRRVLDFSQRNTCPLFSITFDDGWKDNYDYALPILRRYGLPATIFVATEAIANGQLFWPDEFLQKTEYSLRYPAVTPELLLTYFRATSGDPHHSVDPIWHSVNSYLEYLKTLRVDDRRQVLSDYYRFIAADPSPISGRVLGWPHLIEMAQHGFGVGSHTHTHAILETCDDKTILRELITSKKLLEARLKQSVSMFCYPNARYTRRHASLLKEAGYELGFTMDNKDVKADYSRYFIPRISVNDHVCRSGSYFKFRLLGIPRF